MDFPLSSIIFSQQIYILEMREKRGGEGFTSHAGVLLSPMSHYHNRDVWTFLKLMLMIEHMKMMQMPYLDIRSMLLSGQVLHRTNSSQLFWNGLFQKKKTGGLRTYFLEKNPRIFFVFLCTPGNSGKAKLHSWKFGKIMYICYIPWKFHMNFSWSLGNSTLFLINPWKFYMLFLEYSWKFYFLTLSPLPPVCFFLE